MGRLGMGVAIAAVSHNLLADIVEDVSEIKITDEPVKGFHETKFSERYSITYRGGYDYMIRNSELRVGDTIVIHNGTPNIRGSISFQAYVSHVERQTSMLGENVVYHVRAVPFLAEKYWSKPKPGASLFFYRYGSTYKSKEK